FFDIGGHSLKAVILLTRIQKRFEVKIPLRKILENPTIEGIAQYIV
ncbi:MAG: acyl carrier protein, partial [Halanaerobiales bacterium]|nr:acyl carrier protein [Halanaerobiales bacterium]